MIPIGVFAVTIPVLVLIVALPPWIGVLAPPLWIFLGASELDSFRLFYELRASWRRHGLTLLDRTNTGGLQFYGAWHSSTGGSALPYDPGIARVWSLRTRPNLWRTAVRLLSAFVPVIVVDRRGPSDIVESEVKWLETRGFLAKVFMIVSPEDALRHSSDGVKLVDEQTLMAAQWTDAGLNP